MCKEKERFPGGFIFAIATVTLLATKVHQLLEYVLQCKQLLQYNFADSFQNITVRNFLARPQIFVCASHIG